ncbi:hypothetical protein OP10G_4424 [Fimbriimonas ginsengisoli Gsoil 348]|uniref:Uncharacterized protein n=1 Tax=Fimbriimonas ginsengisoli Gsoil 348 TaxID=661478 RepID=A0A068NWP7_FIMGI|nr:hypothetical protein OP10G_4424 [Fimbriimonas ginsengisoli Gsoil 348]
MKVFILLGAAGVGATAMWFWDDSVQKFQVHLVEQQLLSGIQQPAVDIHKVGFHGAFADLHAHHHEEGAAHHDDDEEVKLAPAKEKQLAEADAKARELFASPGGAYTQADIELNGKVPPSERFEKVEFLYSMKPYPGQPIDPILKTKTGGAFDWYIGGKKYHFSSVATIEEFVLRAKKDPSSIQSPEHYVAAKSATTVASR